MLDVNYPFTTAKNYPALTVNSFVQKNNVGAVGTGTSIINPSPHHYHPGFFSERRRDEELSERGLSTFLLRTGPTLLKPGQMVDFTVYGVVVRQGY